MEDGNGFFFKRENTMEKYHFIHSFIFRKQFMLHGQGHDGILGLRPRMLMENSFEVILIYTLVYF